MKKMLAGIVRVCNTSFVNGAGLRQNEALRFLCFGLNSKSGPHQINAETLRLFAFSDQRSSLSGCDSEGGVGRCGEFQVRMLQRYAQGLDLTLWASYGSPGHKIQPAGRVQLNDVLAWMPTQIRSKCDGVAANGLIAPFCLVESAQFNARMKKDIRLVTNSRLTCSTILTDRRA